MCFMTPVCKYVVAGLKDVAASRLNVVNHSWYSDITTATAAPIYDSLRDTRNYVVTIVHGGCSQDINITHLVVIINSQYCTKAICVNQRKFTTTTMGGDQQKKSRRDLSPPSTPSFPIPSP